MKKIFMLCFLLPITFLGNSENIEIKFNNPKQDELSGDTLIVSVSITSTYEIASVFASVENMVIELNYDLTYKSYRSKIPLNQFNQGSLLLKAIAMDLFNNVDSSSVTFIYDTPPVLELITPSSESFANPTLSVLANCYDEGDNLCYIKVSLSEHSEEIFRIESGITEEIDLSQFLSHYSSVNLFFAAIDRRNQKSESIYYKVYIASNPFLKEVARMGYSISDFDGSNLLCLKPNTNALIYNLESMLYSNIYSQNYGFSYSQISSNGAVLKEKNSNKLFEWKSDILTEFSSTSSNSNIIVNGDNVVWTNYFSDSINIFDLIEKQDTVIKCQIPYLPYGVDDKGFDLSDDGSVAYSASDYNIHLYKDGIDTQITFDDSETKRNVYVQTDGSSFIYHKIPNTSNPYIEDFTLAMHDGTNETILRDSRSTFSQFIEERINNGYIAFENISNAGINQVYLIDTLKQVKQVSAFGTSSKLEYLNANGEVSFINKGERYLTQKNGSTIHVGSCIGLLSWDNNRWFVTIANTLLEIDINLNTQAIEKNNLDILLYPNPVINELCYSIPISAPNEIILRIYDMFGTTVFHSKRTIVDTNDYHKGTIPVDNLTSGIYIFEISSLNFITTKVFVKE